MRAAAEAEAASLVPPWLEPLLTTHFFSTCSLHSDSARSECNMYCLDCSAAAAAAFCFYCRSESHDGHRVIQIRRSSYHDVVRVAEIQKVLDIGGVHTYVINSARVIFLNERPQPRATAKVASPHACQICARSLLDPFRFCSLGCKLVGIKRKGDARFEPGEGEASGSGNVTGGLPDRGARAGSRDGAQRQQQHDIRLSSTAPPQHTSRRRKGTPHRAPFYS